MEHKSERMMQIALANGWKAQVKPEIPESKRYEEIIWNLYAVRDKESLHVMFMGNRQYESTYIYGEKRTSPPHKAAVMKILTGKPDLKKLDKKSALKIIESEELPFTPESSAFEILLAVLGKQITWVRKIDGEVLSGYVAKETNLGKKYFRVYEAKTGRRLLEWQDREGFHAVALEQIIGVG